MEYTFKYVRFTRGEGLTFVNYSYTYCDIPDSIACQVAIIVLEITIDISILSFKDVFVPRQPVAPPRPPTFS